MFGRAGISNDFIVVENGSDRLLRGWPLLREPGWPGNQESFGGLDATSVAHSWWGARCADRPFLAHRALYPMQKRLGNGH